MGRCGVQNDEVRTGNRIELLHVHVRIRKAKLSAQLVRVSRDGSNMVALLLLPTLRTTYWATNYNVLKGDAECRDGSSCGSSCGISRPSSSSANFTVRDGLDLASFWPGPGTLEGSNV